MRPYVTIVAVLEMALRSVALAADRPTAATGTP